MALSLKDIQVVVHYGGRADVTGTLNITNCRWIPLVVNEFTDEL